MKIYSGAVKYIIALFSFVASIFVAYSTTENQFDIETGIWESKIDSIREKRAIKLKETISQKMLTLSVVQSFFEASNTVSRSEFVLFNQKLLKEKEVVQVCWQSSDSEEIYAANSMRNSLCEDLDLLEPAEVISADDLYFASSLFTRSGSSSQKGRATVLFRVTEIGSELTEENQGYFSEYLILSDVSSNILSYIDMQNSKVLTDEFDSAGVAYLDLDRIGKINLIYATRINLNSDARPTIFDHWLLALFICLIGLIIASVLFVLIQRVEYASKEIDSKNADLTETKAELVDLSNRNQLALEASRIGVWDWDVESKQFEWDNRMFDLYETDAIRFSGTLNEWKKRIYPDDITRVLNDFQLASKGGSVFDSKHRIVTPKGKIKHIRSMAEAIKNKQGFIENVIGTSWDITESVLQREAFKESNRQLKQSYEELDQFSYRTSHDLKAPLASTVGLSDIMLEDLKDGDYEEVAQNILVIKKQAETLIDLVTKLLDTAKADQVGEVSECINFEQVIERVRLANAAVLGNSNVSLESICSLESEWRISSVRVFQILNNLVTNGIRYRSKERENKFVKIQVKEVNKNLEISVQDNGIGFPVKKRETAFNMFEKLHGDSVSGTGLGLYIVKKHAEALGAKLELVSTDQGSCIKLSISREAAERVNT